jgi:hypothetical protein
MGGKVNKEPIDKEISRSDSSTDYEPLPMMKLYERPEKKIIVYDKQMIKNIFLSEYIKYNVRIRLRKKKYI